MIATSTDAIAASPLSAARRLWRLALAGWAVAGLAACFELKEPVIGLDIARAVPGVEGEWTTPDEDTVVIFPGDHPNEYRFRLTDIENDVDTGRLRLVPLGGALYLAQAEVDGTGEVFILYFKAKDGGRYEQLEPNEQAAGLASRYGVTVEDLGYGYEVDGSPAKVRNYILALGPEHLVRTLSMEDSMEELLFQ